MTSCTHALYATVSVWKTSGKLQSFAFKRKTDMNERCTAQKHRIILLTHWRAFFAILLQTVAATTNLGKPHESASTAGFFCVLFSLLWFSNNRRKKEASIDWMHFTLHYYCYRKHANRITRYGDSSFYSGRVASIAIADVRVPFVCAAQTVDSSISSCASAIAMMTDRTAFVPVVTHDGDDAPGANIQLCIIIYNWVAFASSTSSSSWLLLLFSQCHCIHYFAVDRPWNFPSSPQIDANATVKQFIIDYMHLLTKQWQCRWRQGR